MLNENKPLFHKIQESLQESLEDLESQAYISGKNFMYAGMLRAMEKFFDPASRELEYDVIFSTLRRVMSEWKAGERVPVAVEQKMEILLKALERYEHTFLSIRGMLKSYTNDAEQATHARRMAENALFDIQDIKKSFEKND